MRPGTSRAGLLLSWRWPAKLRGEIAKRFWQLRRRDLAARPSRLSKATNLASHPDVQLLPQFREVLKRGTADFASSSSGDQETGWFDGPPFATGLGVKTSFEEA